MRDRDEKDGLQFSYRSKGWWHNSVLFHFFISGLIWLPLAYFVIYMLILDFNVPEDLGFALILFSTLVALALFLFRRAQTKLRFPEVEVTNHHLVLNRPLRKRCVYNLSEIKSPKFIFGILYFRHLGWPVVEPFHMPKEEQEKLLALLSADR